MTKSKKPHRTITLCSSAAFFQSLFPIYESLRKLGYEVLLPISAIRMKKKDDFEVSHNKTWFTNEADYRIKTKLIRDHFKKVIQSDAILVVNLDKKGISGYVGGNTLMEMALAYHYSKPIFLWNPVDGGNPFEEEIMGLGSVVIDRDLTKIKLR